MAYTTKRSLLRAIGRGDEVSWREFYDTYRPLIVFCARDRLESSEIDDLIQTVMVNIFRSGEYFRYDPAKGRFRDYLGRVVHNAIVDMLRKRRRSVADAHAAEAGAGADGFESMWREEWERHLLAQAMVELRSRVEVATFQAFDLYAMQGQPPKRVADFLGVGVSQVYIAKSRCLAMLREIVAELRNKEEGPAESR